MAQSMHLSRCPLTPNLTTDTMLHYTIVFFVVAIIAAVLGFGGIAGASSDIAKICFFIFLVVAVISLFFGKRPAA